VLELAYASSLRDLRGRIAFFEVQDATPSPPARALLTHS